MEQAVWNYIKGGAVIKVNLPREPKQGGKVVMKRN
jgi:hypothetical protein